MQLHKLATDLYQQAIKGILPLHYLAEEVGVEPTRRFKPTYEISSHASSPLEYSSIFYIKPKCTVRFHWIPFNTIRNPGRRLGQT